MGNAIYLAWEDIDYKLKERGHKYFGSHAFVEGARDENDFEITIDSLIEEDYEKYCLLFEKYDINKDYEPESLEDMASYVVSLPGSIAMGVMQEALGESGLLSFGTALATYNGVLFAEKEMKYRAIEQGERIACASLESQISAASADAAQTKDGRQVTEPRALTR